MPTRLRLQRKGKKGNPFYHIVSVDGRAPRDGKFIERLGYYNPTTDPATIVLDFDRALHWVQVGAQPSDTVRMILSHEGVLLMDHLIRGKEKGALTDEQVKEKFEAWKKEKIEKRQQKINESNLTEKEKKKKRLEEEKKINEDRAAELAKKHAAEAGIEAKEEDAAENEGEAGATETEAATETEVEQAPAEEPKKEEPAAEETKKEEPAAEKPAEDPEKDEEKSENKEEKKD